ncbi:MAG: PAS domain S-box protein [Dehalococcoidia bacterium]|nr:PAS domain S-box protein [Dehalococcoidia bacterium]
MNLITRLKRSFAHTDTSPEKRLSANAGANQSEAKTPRENEDIYRQLVEQADDGICIIQDEIIQYANPASLKILGYTPWETIGTPIARYVHPDAFDEVMDRYQKKMSGEEIRSRYETTFLHRDGRKILVEINASATSFNNKPADLVIVRDVTERRRVEESLHESEERFRGLIENASDVIYELTAEGIFTYLSPNWLELIGEPASEAVGKTFEPYVHPDDVHLIWEYFDRISNAAGKPSSVDYRVLRLDGSIHWYSSNGSALRDRDGNVAGYIGIARDITERKRAEEKTRLFSQAVENAYDSFVLTDMNRNVVYANQSAIKTFGYLPEGMLKLNVAQFTEIPKDAESITKEMETKGNWNGEVISVRKNGESFPVVLSISLVSDTDNRPIGMLGVFRDITERKQAEEALRRERDFTNSLIETAQAIVLVLDPQGRIVRFNSHMEEISGYSLAEVRGKDWFSTFLPEREMESTRNVFLKAVGDIRTLGNVSSIVTKDGREREIEWYDKTLKDADGNIVGLLSTGQDITERKRADVMLRESEQKYRTLIENSSINLFILDRDGIFQTMNASGAALFGGKPADFIGKSLFDLNPRDIAEEYYESNRRTIETGIGRIYERDWDFPTGRKTMLVTEQVLKDARGNNVALQSSSIDITERKRMEQALQQSNQQLNEQNEELMAAEEALNSEMVETNKARAYSEALIHAMPDGFVALDFAGNVIDINEKQLELIGYSREEIVGLSMKTDTLGSAKEIEAVLERMRRLEAGVPVENAEMASLQKAGIGILIESP